MDSGRPPACFSFLPTPALFEALAGKQSKQIQLQATPCGTKDQYESLQALHIGLQFSELIWSLCKEHNTSSRLHRQWKIGRLH
eukprot:Skav205331  [mRNA]  locus=scaffold3444:392615:392863:+ [translate_table: standard]